MRVCFCCGHRFEAEVPNHPPPATARGRNGSLWLFFHALLFFHIYLVCFSMPLFYTYIFFQAFSQAFFFPMPIFFFAYFPPCVSFSMALILLSLVFLSSLFCCPSPSPNRFVDVFSSLDQPARMVLYAISPNPYDPPVALQELHSAMDERVVALRPKLAPPEV